MDYGYDPSTKEVPQSPAATPKMLFDAYVPTRTSDSVEVRVRSSAKGPVCLHFNTTEVTLAHPSVSYQGCHFYRHTFDDLPAKKALRITARHLKTRAEVSVETDTLPAPPGESKLSIGLMADLHLPGRKATIDQYRPGTKRLSGLAHELATRYIKRLEALGADIIVLPGDLVDPCTRRTITALAQVLSSVALPCYPIIGNHEPWSPGGESLFYHELGLPDEGFFTVRKNGARLLMLSTPTPGALHSSSRQIRWLKGELEASDAKEDVVLFSHFSLLLHPCVQGPKNDGYQLLDNHKEIRRLISKFPNVRLFVAGHKNVPSMVIRDGVIHTLSPQLIQAPCGYDLLHLYGRGVRRTTYEIDEQHYCEVARAAYAHDWPGRYGDEHSRNFCIDYPA